MENKKEYEIIKLEKKVNTINVIKTVITALGGIVSVVLMGNATKNIEIHNSCGTFVNSLLSIIVFIGAQVNAFVSNKKLNKMEDKIMTLKRQP